MATVQFKKGTLANLPSTHKEGTIYVVTDERAIYFDSSNSARIRIGDFQEFETAAALNANTNPSTSALYYVKEINCLAKWDGTKYVQINLDTGATDVEFTGEGNVITNVSYSAVTRKLTFTKGITAAELGTASDASTAITLYGVKKYAKEQADAVLGTDDDTTASVTVKGARLLAESKVASVTNTDKSINVTGTATNPVVSVALHTATGDERANLLTLKADGLFVETPAAADTYEIAAEDSEDYAKVYKLIKKTNGTGDGTQVGVSINIPKDMVVQSGAVETNPEGKPAGTYLVLTLANATNDKVYINVGDLIEYVTSGSRTGDMIVVDVSDDHKVTATITDGTVTLAKLVTDVQNKITGAIQEVQVNGTAITPDSDRKVNVTAATGDNNGEVKIAGQAVAVKGLASAAYKTEEYFIGGDDADKDDDTIRGAKAYADDKVTSALTWEEF